MASVVSVKALRKSYGKTVAVDGISLEVEEGSIFGMVGPNGAGKTTSIECMEGLRKPDSGEISILGFDPLKDERRLRFLVGAQLQKSQLPDRMRVGEAMELFSSFYPDPEPKGELLERLGLADKVKSYVSKLSGGQLQRVFIALALVNKPRLVFLDELTTGLDPQARHGVWDLVRDIRKEGRTVFLSTHFMEEAELLCDRVAIIDRGRIVANDSPGALKAALGGGPRVTVTLAAPAMPQGLEDLDFVAGASIDGNRLTVNGIKEAPGTQTLISAVANALNACGAAYLDIKSQETNLEDVFLSMTGRAMRD
jgi:ABC-2 type transport system ATP-binding protein